MCLIKYIALQIVGMSLKKKKLLKDTKQQKETEEVKRIEVV
jgi:hypothetical protein